MYCLISNKLSTSYLSNSIASFNSLTEGRVYILTTLLIPSILCRVISKIMNEDQDSDGTIEGGYDDGDTWKSPSGQYGGKYKGQTGATPSRLEVDPEFNR